MRCAFASSERSTHSRPSAGPPLAQRAWASLPGTVVADQESGLIVVKKQPAKPPAAWPLTEQIRRTPSYEISSLHTKHRE
jgi:hypothetical protein